MSTHNICFYGELKKIILQLTSNTSLSVPLFKPYAGKEIDNSNSGDEKGSLHKESKSMVKDNTCLWALRAGKTQTGLLSYRS